MVRRQLGVPVSLVLRDPADLPDVDLGVRLVSWVGVPVGHADGSVRAYLCAVDDRPRAWSEGELETLRDLAASCATELALLDAERRSTRARAAAEAARTSAEAAERQSRLLLALSEALAGATTVDEVVETVVQVALRELQARSCRVLLVDHDQRRLRCALGAGPQSWIPERYREPHLDRDLDAPAVATARSGEPAFYEDPAQFDAAHSGELDAAAGGPPPRGALLPLLAGPRTEGVLGLTWSRPGAFPPQARQTLVALGRYSGQALQRARLLEDQQEAARTLQEALLTELPSPPGLEVAARYAPAATGHRVGGDWYDAFTVPGGSTVVVIGDVVGHDLAAAAAMGSLRSMLRALAHDRPDSPAETVQRLDRAVVGLGEGVLATLVCAKVDAAAGPGGSRLVRWTSAGHLPPVVLLPDGSTRLLDAPAELLVGVDPESGRTDHALLVPPGATLVLYTDGLVERRGEDLSWSLERLREVVSRLAGLAPAALVERLAAEQCTGACEDDVALLAVRVGASGAG
jgi:serine phosphatase RsbU (regulator of sigma subunit)